MMKNLKESAFLILLVVVMMGCTSEETKLEVGAQTENETSSILEVLIPSDIVQYYGMLNIESKVGDFEKVENSDGSVTVFMQQQNADEMQQEIVKMFNEFEAVISGENEKSVIKKLTYNDQFSELIIQVSNREVLQEEDFLLTEELLMKNALVYQIVNKIKPTLKIQYFDTDSNQFLGQKTVPKL